MSDEICAEVLHFRRQNTLLEHKITRTYTLKWSQSIPRHEEKIALHPSFLDIAGKLQPDPDVAGQKYVNLTFL